MGKSKQKTKSDKIDLLRKQYDAFLEEDKRRKERNDNILQKLDKMRVCEKLVPYTSKVQYVSESCIKQPYHRYESLLEPAKEYQISQTQARPGIQNFAIPIQTIDKSILKEISKTYILIPKLRLAGPVNLREQIYHESQNMDDNDWKSKYDILNKLKQSEKEELNTGDIIQTSVASYKNNQANDNYIFEGKHKCLEKVSIIPQHSGLNQNVNNLQPSQESKILKNATLMVTKEEKESFINKNRERDLGSYVTYSQAPLESNLQNIEYINNEQNSSNLNESNNVENEGSISFAPKTDADNVNVFVQDSESEQMQTLYNSAQYYDAGVHKTVNSKDNCKTEIGQVDQVGTVNDGESNHHFDGHYSQEHDISVYENQTNGSAITQETNFNNNNSDILHYNESHENYVIPTEQNKNREIEDFNSAKDKENDDAYEEHQQSNVFVEDTVNIDHEAAIEDFESEQTNMFYTQPDQQSQYGNGMDGNVLDQVQKSQDENYLQDEQYNAHYDAVLSDQVYSVEVNDDEQVLQRYDQTYEQQYIGEEGQPPIVGQYDHPKPYTDQQQPYDGQHVYENNTSQNQQLYEGQQQYEGEQFEVQQPETQPFEGEQQYEGHQPQTQAFGGEQQYEGHQPETQAFEGEPRYEGQELETQAFEGEQQYEGHQPETQAFEGEQQYERHQPETQAFEGERHYEGQQLETQAFKGEQQYEGQQYEQTQNLPSEDLYKNDTFNTEQNTEQEFDKDVGLPQIQSSELQSQVKEIEKSNI